MKHTIPRFFFLDGRFGLKMHIDALPSIITPSFLLHCHLSPLRHILQYIHIGMRQFICDDSPFGICLLVLLGLLGQVDSACDQGKLAGLPERVALPSSPSLLVPALHVPLTIAQSEWPDAPHWNRSRWDSMDGKACPSFLQMLSLSTIYFQGSFCESLRRLISKEKQRTAYWSFRIWRS